MDPRFFETPRAFRSWLQKHHDTEKEVWVGFHKKSTGRPSMTYAESVEEALCFGWIDGVRRSIDETSYVMRFSPRTARSNWSAVNIKRVKELTASGRMRPAGLAAFEKREKNRSNTYSYEQRHLAELNAGQLLRFRANGKAWAFFTAQPDGYRKTAIWWVVSAKKRETRDRRLAQLIEDSARGKRVPPLAPGGTTSP